MESWVLVLVLPLIVFPWANIFTCWVSTPHLQGRGIKEKLEGLTQFQDLPLVPRMCDLRRVKKTAEAGLHCLLGIWVAAQDSTLRLQDRPKITTKAGRSQRLDLGSQTS